MSANLITFELKDGIQTKDNFFVTMKGFVEVSENINENDILLAINQSCQKYVNRVPLLDALDLINHDEAQKLIQGLEQYADKVTKLEISTVDAVDVGDFKDIDVGIDPELEGQKKSKGIIGRIKGIFKR